MSHLFVIEHSKQSGKNWVVKKKKRCREISMEIFVVVKAKEGVGLNRTMTEKV